jgi:hypothetical protein
MDWTEDDRARFRARTRPRAVHEAAHAIACLVLDSPIRSATAWLDAEVEHAGHATGAAAILITLMGDAALELLGVRGPGPEWPSVRQQAENPERDSCRAYRAPLAMAGDARAAELYAKVYGLALRTATLQWQAIDRVADLLQSKTYVSGSEIGEVARDVN